MVPSVMSHSSLSLEGVQHVVGLLGDHICPWLAPASACSFPQMRFLGKFKFLGDHCPNHLRVKGRNIVSLRKAHLHPWLSRHSQGGCRSTCFPSSGQAKQSPCCRFCSYRVTDLTHFSAQWLAEYNLLSGLPDVY